MSSFPQRWFGALVMGMGFLLPGCTDAMVDPADGDAPKTRMIEADNREALQHAAPLDANAGYDELVRLVIRFLELPPGHDLPADSLGSPGDTLFLGPIIWTPVPYSAPFDLPLDTASVPADTTSYGSGS